MSPIITVLLVLVAAAVCGALGFYLGGENRKRTAEAKIGSAEDEAKRVVWADRPVTIRFADAEEAARLPLRKHSERSGTLRLVEVADMDLSACGGTHVTSTGAIGVIAIASTERLRGGVRIEFVCGRRALRAPRMRASVCRRNTVQRCTAKRRAAVERARGALRRPSKDRRC